MSHSRSPRTTRRKPTVLRRSFVLPARLIEQVGEAVPPEYGANVNASVRHALEQYVAHRETERFERAMERMAADPQVRAINAELNDAFRAVETEGLPDDPSW